MGKGKRTRDRRAGGPPRPSAGGVDVTGYPFVVDPETAGKLGAAGLDVLAANLWLRDCQTCGYALSSDPADRPSLVVDDMIVMAQAHLHHQRCRRAQLCTQISVSKAALVSYDCTSVMFPGFSVGEDGAQVRDDRPMLMVNPNLESLMIRPEDGVWAATTTWLYSEMGLRTPGKDLQIDRPVPDAVADLSPGGDVTVTFQDSALSWSCGSDVPWREAARDLGGVLLAVTTAAVPSELRQRPLGEFVDLMQTGQVVMGWIGLRGTTPPLPDDLAVPDLVGNYLLHYGPGEATVGEMLGTAPAQIVSFDQARGWAEAQLATLLDDPDVTERLIGWRRGKDPAIWHTTHALTVGSFALRFTADGWQLVKLFSQAMGKTMSDDEATDWATSVSRVLGKVRIIGWSPDPGTGTPGFVTLRGTGGPK